tara:strand:+ start:156 stop:290 length:135 start_codon:yes stop_codon:yes gene_type:complete
MIEFEKIKSTLEHKFHFFWYEYKQAVISGCSGLCIGFILGALIF